MKRISSVASSIFLCGSIFLLIGCPDQWELEGEWPTYGYSSDQSRAKMKPGASISPEPSLLWTRYLPPERRTMFYSSAVIGDDGTLYIPFFGEWDYYPSGGVQAVTGDGEVKWYFTARETEAQSPLMAKSRNTGDTVIIFGSAGRPYGNPLFPDPSRHYPSLMAIYDKDTCRCCVNRDDATSFCEFSCVADEHCEPYDPDSPYEWRHTAHCDGNEAKCDYVDTACAAWLISTDEMAPAQIPQSPGLGLGYYEVSSTSLLSKDGRTVYYFVSGVDVGLPLPPDLTNFVAAVDVNTKTLKWVLTEDDPNGWDKVGTECHSGHNQLGWIFSSAMLSDGSILLGTRAGCLVRVVDYGSEGKTEGVYKGPHPSITGLTVESSGTDDFIYVATHGQVHNQYGDLYKTSRDRLTAEGEGHEPLWVYNVGEEIEPDPDDAPGLFGSPLLAKIQGETYVYVVVSDWNWPTPGCDSDGIEIGGCNWLDPDRGWIVKVPGDGPDGSQEYLPLQSSGEWYPAFNCTMDGGGNIWMHGGKNRSGDDGGRILRTDQDLSQLTAISDGTTERFGFSEIVLGSNYLYAVSSPAWEGDDGVKPVIHKLR